MSLSFHIDQPADWGRFTRCVIIRGWCFAPTGSITAIRLRTADRTLDGVVGLPRPDVKLALPAAPDDNTGFEIRGTLPSGRVHLVFEARLADGGWVPFIERTVRIKPLLLPLWLGGGEWTELMFFQMPAHMAHPPRPVQPEKFPAPARAPRPALVIVTPSYQQARYLPETMRSVLDQQPGVDCAYVVQDGGSSDGSREVIERFARQTEETGDRRLEAGMTGSVGPASTASGPRLAHADPASRLPSPVSTRLLAWTSERDAGQADAIAKGFARTSGGPDDLMAWINSDDYYLPGALGFVADYFAAHPEVDVLYGNRIVVDEESREIARWFLPPHDDEVLRLNDFVPQETVFWRRRIWEKAGGLDTSFQFAVDWDLLLRFAAAGAHIVRVPWFLACFRAHPAQKTAAFMHCTGQDEINRLRARTFGRPFPAHEIEGHPLLMRYLRRSAFLEFAWRLGLRAP